MPSTSEIATRIETALPGARVDVQDLGGGDHLFAHVVAPQFGGLSLIEHILGPGKPIHALKIKTEVAS